MSEAGPGEEAEAGPRKGVAAGHGQMDLQGGLGTSRGWAIKVKSRSRKKAAWVAEWVAS